jgi:hypothetical protein
MDSRTKEKLIALGLMTRSKDSEIAYSWQHHGNSQMNFRRLINGQPYLYHAAPSASYEKKKLIINYWQALDTIPDYQNTIEKELQQYLLMAGFEIYCRSGKSTFNKIEVAHSTIKDFWPCNTDTLRTELTTTFKDSASEYFIIDHMVRNKLLIACIGHSLDAKRIDDPHTIELDFALTRKENIEKLIELIDSKTIHQFSSNWKFKESNINITWSNQFDKTELLTFLKLFAENELDQTQPTNYFPEYIVKLDVQLRKEHQIDVSAMTNLKVLSINGHLQLDSVHGLETCTQLEQFSVLNVSDTFIPIAIDQLVNLRILRLGENVKIIGPVIPLDMPFLNNFYVALSPNNFTAYSNENVQSLITELEVKKLATIDLNHYPKIEHLLLDDTNVVSLENCQQLKTLHLRGIKNINAEDINSLINLSNLSLDDMAWETLSSLNLPELKTLSLIKMYGLSTIGNLTNFKILNHLTIYDCKSLRELDLTNLIELREFSIDTDLDGAITGLNTCNNLMYLEMGAYPYSDNDSDGMEGIH